jgi:hypothetical protein
MNRIAIPCGNATIECDLDLFHAVHERLTYNLINAGYAGDELDEMTVSMLPAAIVAALTAAGVDQTLH